MLLPQEHLESKLRIPVNICLGTDLINVTMIYCMFNCVCVTEIEGFTVHRVLCLSSNMSRSGPSVTVAAGSPGSPGGGGSIQPGSSTDFSGKRHPFR